MSSKYVQQICRLRMALNLFRSKSYGILYAIEKGSLVKTNCDISLAYIYYYSTQLLTNFVLSLSFLFNNIFIQIHVRIFLTERSW